MSEEIIENDGKNLVKKKRRERIVRKGRLKQERLRNFMRLIICLGIISGVFYGSQNKGWYLNSDVFIKPDNNIVRIINNKIVSTDKIYAVLKNVEVPEKPIFVANTKQIKNGLMELAPVENVYIRRFAFPARLLIIVRERTPVITISPDEKIPPVASFTNDGKLIGKEFMPLDKQYKTILVLTYGNKGDDYHKWDLKKVKEIQKIVRYVETYSKEKVEYIDHRDPNNIFVKIQTVNIRLGKADNNIYKRIERIPSILPQVKLVESKIKYLDLGWDKVNYLKLQ